MMGDGFERRTDPEFKNKERAGMGRDGIDLTFFVTSRTWWDGVV